MGREEKPSFVARHKPSLVVLASQISAAVVHGVVKSLENGVDHVDPFQILLIRMIITGVGCSLGLWLRRVPESPWGHRDVRPMLLLRAVGGVLGAAGMYYSIRYLTLSQATALNFLAPMGAMIISKYMDHGTFTFIDRAGAAIALAGVVMVVQPDNFFKPGETLSLGPKPDAFAKWKGLACGLIGVMGTITALTTMRRIGSRAHPLTVVNYFAWVVVLVAMTVVIIKQLSWPSSPKAWAYMIIVGVFGGLMEFLLTLGIASDASSVATIMIYSQVLWALILDRIFWHVSMNVWTFVGVGSVIGSLTLVSLAKEIPAFGRTKQRYETLPIIDDNGVTVHEIDLDSLYDYDETDEIL
ncbi:hypothetical protein M406DRAFT_251067 [Cryphonectria parasitica EP155]|uniref:EamA domain-containing protein n=1 Tax=Cryphonectria parasitica (strain ATCC 38755 / EP155) TaxID=660469 RepID=A0A9P4Y913_CRYP1|nr:uncharacterized protein M406DRAFT_251067 [Cryphonectria parasitica EP155]KAF3768728.1 hypothetical protein M406DRAFT_251067 [Cryphonectria parasitica EP155]